MRNYLIYNGIASDSFDLYLGGQASFNAPKRKFTKVKVPGRNGDIIIDQNCSFENINVPYNIVGMNNFKEKTTEIKEWLASSTRYCRIEDTYDPTVFRMGMIVSDISFTMKRLNQTGKAKIVFDCKPQRFLISGEMKNKIYGNDVIYNPTEFKSNPLIRVDGHGVLMINGNTIIVGGSQGTTIIDSETMDCYTLDRQNVNRTVLFQGNKFPVLVPKENDISYSGNITSVVIIPRWWTL